MWYFFTSVYFVPSLIICETLLRLNHIVLHLNGFAYFSAAWVGRESGPGQGQAYWGVFAHCFDKHNINHYQII